MDPLVCFSLHHNMWLGNARHHLTRLLTHFPWAQWSQLSHTYFLFFLHIQRRKAATLAGDVNDIRILRAGELSEISHFINVWNQGYTSSVPSLRASRVPQMASFMVFQRNTDITSG